MLLYETLQLQYVNVQEGSKPSQVSVPSVSTYRPRKPRGCSLSSMEALEKEDLAKEDLALAQEGRSENPANSITSTMELRLRLAVRKKWQGSFGGGVFCFSQWQLQEECARTFHMLVCWASQGELGHECRCTGSYRPEDIHCQVSPFSMASEELGMALSPGWGIASRFGRGLGFWNVWLIIYIFLYFISQNNASNAIQINNTTITATKIS